MDAAGVVVDFEVSLFGSLLVVLNRSVSLRGDNDEQFVIIKLINLIVDESNTRPMFLCCANKILDHQL